VLLECVIDLQAVFEHPVGLVCPQFEHFHGVLDALTVAQLHGAEHFVDMTQVPDVVRARRHRFEGISYFFEQM